MIDSYNKAKLAKHRAARANTLISTVAQHWGDDVKELAGAAISIFRDVQGMQSIDHGGGSWGAAS